MPYLAVGKFMSAIVKEVYDAFRAAAVDDEKATAAAKAMANSDARFGRIETGLLGLKWMVGLVIVVEILPVLKSLL